MNWTKQVLQEVADPYAVGVHSCDGRKKVVTATELKGPCMGIWADTLEKEMLWEDQGGTMNTFQISPDGSFLAIQRFYKGFHCKHACIVRVEQKEGWKQTELALIPFLHRFCVVLVGEEPYLVCSVLCADKESPEDWSQPGCVRVAKLPEKEGEELRFWTVLEGIHRNHGLYYGQFRGEQTVFVAGDEGIYQICVPQKEGDAWSARKILDRPVSDCTVVDMDGDGEDELVTIEPFHGGRIVVNKWLNNQWKQVYHYSVDFGHAIWSGMFLGRPAFLIGYRGANQALLLFQLQDKSGKQWRMEVTCLDEHGGPTNVAVVHEEGREKIFACNGAANQVVLYTVEE